LFDSFTEEILKLHIQILDRDIELQNRMTKMMERMINPPIIGVHDNYYYPAFTNIHPTWYPGVYGLTPRPKVLRFLQLIMKIIRGKKKDR
jgi:hypothetical protein